MLDKAGYTDRGFFRTTDGYAIATQIERINPDGTPFAADQRWHIAPTGLLSFGDGFTFDKLIGDCVTAVTHADPGHYRIFVFVVTDVPVTGPPPGSTNAMTVAAANTLAENGAASLPSAFGEIPFSDSYSVTALVYEFERPSVGTGANLSIPSDMPGIVHLQRAGLLP
jgi:hypothetical protein